MFIIQKLITNNINILEKKFKFEYFKKQQSLTALEKIKSIEYVDIGKISKMSKSTINKLAKCTEEDIKRLNSDKLVNYIQNHPIYKNSISIEGDKLTPKNPNEFKKLLDFLKSDILSDTYTGEYYGVRGAKKKITIPQPETASV